MHRIEVAALVTTLSEIWFGRALHENKRDANGIPRPGRSSATTAAAPRRDAGATSTATAAAPRRDPDATSTTTAAAPRMDPDATSTTTTAAPRRDAGETSATTAAAAPRCDAGLAHGATTAAPPARDDDATAAAAAAPLLSRAATRSELRASRGGSRESRLEQVECVLAQLSEVTTIANNIQQREHPPGDRAAVEKSRRQFDRPVAPGRHRHGRQQRHRARAWRVP